MTWLPLMVALLVAQAVPAQVASPADDLARHVQVTLKLRDGKTVFRSGEPIRLVATFKADGPGYQADITVDERARPEDEILITPADGVFRWRELQLTPDTSGRDYGSVHPLSKPIDMTFALNHWLRFDEPGEYTVRIRTRRAFKTPRTRFDTPWLTTNAVTFQIVPMSEHEEEIEARRLGTLLDELTDDLGVQTERCQDLAFLTGDAGTREKVRRYLAPKGRHTANWAADLREGLYISRSTALVIQMLEGEMRDPVKPAAYVFDIVDLRLWMELPALVAAASGDMSALRARKQARREVLLHEYLTEVVASLAVRAGSARRDSASFILWLVSSLNQQSSKTRLNVPPRARQILVDEFALIDEFNQAALIQMYWKDIRDPALLPALEKMTTSSDPWVRAMPMAQILELAPERARSIFIAEMLRPRPVTAAAFDDLRDETLPEMDRPLLDHITSLTASMNPRDSYVLRNKTHYLARYATRAVFPEIRQLYESLPPRVERESRLNLLAYLLKWDEAGASERLATELSDERNSYSVLSYLAGVQYSQVVDTAVRARLNSDDASRVEGAVHIIFADGPPSARQALEARLARWVTDWRGRSAELDRDANTVPSQAGLQILLINAILQGKSWKVSDEDAARLTKSCLTETCRKYFSGR